MKKTDSAGTDGRRARAGRSRNAIATALLELIVAGMPHPSARQVAERAGVSPRLVFHHFKDMEALYGELMALQAQRLQPLLEMDITPETPFESRLAAFVNHRVTILEFISPVRKVIINTELISPTIAAELDRLREYKRRQVQLVFAPELSCLKHEEAALISAALQTVSSWTAWHCLRHHQKLPLEAAERVLTRMIRALLPVSV